MITSQAKELLIEILKAFGKMNFDNVNISLSTILARNSAHDVIDSNT